MKSLKTIRRIYAMIAKSKPQYMCFSLCLVLTEIALPFAGIFYLEYLTDTINENRDLTQLLVLCVGYLFVCWVLQMVSVLLDKRLTTMGNALNNAFETSLNYCITHLDYTYLETPEILDKRDRAMEGIKENDGVKIADINRRIISIVSAAAVAAGTFCLVWTVSPLLPLILATIITGTLLIEKKLSNIELENWKKWIPLNRRFRMVYDLMYNVKNAQDVRIYHTYDFFSSKAEGYNTDSLAVMQEEGRTTAFYSILKRLLVMVQFVVVQLFVVSRTLQGLITIGGYTFYVNAANNFSKSTISIVQDAVQIQKILLYMSEYFDFLDLPAQAEQNADKEKAAPPHCIEFRDVSFHYPNAETNTLSHINMKFSLDEKVGIVGRNGTGKTTFIKLLLGFYQPTEGQILLDGRDIREYDPASYRALFSAVFQDFNIYPISIRENITAALPCEEDRLSAILDELELKAKLSKYTYKLDTIASKVIDEEGVDFSGGERQMISLARAIYKPSAVLVLDEPTASLDAKAESLMYRKYHGLSQKKISFFISHRLASCTFCDRILVFGEGRILQQGTHVQLLAQEDGLYAQMFRLQAERYQ